MAEIDGKNRPGNITTEAPPTLIEMVVRGESPELRQLRKKVEEGPDHPSDELLRAYTSHRAATEDTRSIMEHIALCGTCARKALRLTLQQEELLDDLEDASSQPSWLDRLKGFVSNLSFPVMIRPLALEGVRGPKDEDTTTTLKVGDPLTLFVESPADGHVTVFHFSGEGSEPSLVFPGDASDETRVSGGEKKYLLEGEVEGPVGSQFFKIVWTREQLINPREINWADVDAVKEAVSKFFGKLEGLHVDEVWRAAVCEYQVVQD